MPDVFDAAKSLGGRNQKVETGVSRADPLRGRKEPTKPSRSRGVTGEQAKKSERKGKSGERQFGAPLSTPTPSSDAVDKAIAVEVDRMRQNQNSDLNN